MQQMKKLATMVELDNGECYLEIGPKSGDYATADMYLLQPRYETYYFENSRIGVIELLRPRVLVSLVGKE